MSLHVTRTLEAALAGAAGAALGAAAGLVVAGPPGAALGAAVAGFNGLVAGAHGVYDWRTPKGWLAFGSDSSWSLLTTAAGTLLYAVNRLVTRSSPVSDMTRRANRQVHERGFALKRGFALTLGNVISNANPTGRGLNPSFLSRHEELHIWQSRIFGPLFPLVYVLWGAGGAVLATIVWLRHRDESLASLVETACYYNNPFEYWAYRNDENWPPRGANPLLAWKR
jgi:hypothetical protein